MNVMGVLEFETFAIVALVVFDIVLGTINHVFFKQDNISSLAQASIGRKCIIVIGSVLLVLATHINDAHFFNDSVQPMLNTLYSAAVVIVAALLYYEITSVLKHVEALTGLNFLEKFPGLTSEIKHGKEEN